MHHQHAAAPAALPSSSLFRVRTTPLFGPAREVIYWYFTKVPGLTAEVRIAEEEKFAAQGRGAR